MPKFRKMSPTGSLLISGTCIGLDEYVSPSGCVGLAYGKLEQSLGWFPCNQSWLGKHPPPALIVRGPQDGYMPDESGCAYQHDLPDSELHLLNDAGHWLLETHLSEALPLARDFLSRVLP